MLYIPQVELLVKILYNLRGTTRTKLALKQVS